MAQRTIDQFYPTYAEAVQVVADLTAAGVSPADVSLIESEMDARLPQNVAASPPQNPIRTSATLGAAIGGGIGALDGVGAITIPFTDPLVATGWVLPCVIFAIVFAVIGAAIGAIIKASSRNKQSLDIASRLQRGQHLVMVLTTDQEAAMVQSIMSSAHTVPRAALATSEPAYDTLVPTTATTVGDEVDPAAPVERRQQYR